MLRGASQGAKMPTLCQRVPQRLFAAERWQFCARFGAV
jgi:hypothetical protein